MAPIMTPDQISTNIWATRYAQQAAELVAVLTALNVAQERIKALEATKSADVIPMKKDGES